MNNKNKTYKLIATHIDCEDFAGNLVEFVAMTTENEALARVMLAEMTRRHNIHDHDPLTFYLVVA